MKYSIGIDFGTGSGRVLIIDIKTGSIIGMSVIHFKNEKVKENLANVDVPYTFALQDPTEYIRVLKEGIPEAIKNAKIHKSQIVGLGIDATSASILLTDNQFKPLSEYQILKKEPHSYLKLWKHHGANKEAEKMLEVARNNKSRWLGNYGFNVNSEWMIPKVLELINHAPNIVKKAAHIMEVGDWLTSKLIEENVRSNCSRGFKTFWNEEEGFFYEYYKKVDSQLPKIINEKLEGRLVKIGEKAGHISTKMSTELGLPANLPIAPSIIDAHASLLGIGSTQKNELTMVMGTSTCHLMLHDEQKQIPGISGNVKDAIIPNLFAYEAGQSAVGDLFNHVANRAPKSYLDEAKNRKMHIYELLEEKASLKSPGQTGLIALDWHNGNRSILSDSKLRGVLIGETLNTKIEDIYKAYMEATAFGAKMIINNYEEWGMQIDKVFACGGIPQKNELLMQIYADILNRPIHVSASYYAPAIGAAILGSVAGREHETVVEAVHDMKQPISKTVHPISQNVKNYQKLFEIYKTIHDYYGLQSHDIMQQLDELTHQQN